MVYNNGQGAAKSIFHRSLLCLKLVKAFELVDEIDEECMVTI